MRRAALLALLLAAARPAAAFGRPSRVLQGKHGANTDTTLTLYPILDPEALCNDGSRSGYYYAPATNPAKASGAGRQAALKGCLEPRTALRPSSAD